jgi:hypothetical protein
MSVPDFADVEASMAETNMDMLANCFVTATGTPFAARLTAADREVFDVANVGDYSLRYLVADATLAKGDEITIAASVYAVASTPQKINPYEYVAELILVE